MALQLQNVFASERMRARKKQRQPFIKCMVAGIEKLHMGGVSRLEAAPCNGPGQLLRAWAGNPDHSHATPARWGGNGSNQIRVCYGWYQIAC